MILHQCKVVAWVSESCPARRWRPCAGRSSDQIATCAALPSSSSRHSDSGHQLINKLTGATLMQNQDRDISIKKGFRIYNPKPNAKVTLNDNKYPVISDRLSISEKVTRSYLLSNSFFLSSFYFSAVKA